MASDVDRGDRFAFTTVDPQSPAALSSLEAYFRELDDRFVGGFDPGDTLTADAPTMRPPCGSFVVAEVDGSAVACGGVLRFDDEAAEIKRMWVHADWRGCGLGSRMLARLEDEVRGLGYRRVVLDTNAVLTEAVAMYQRYGYRPVDRYNDNPYAHHWFEKTLGSSVAAE